MSQQEIARFLCSHYDTYYKPSDIIKEMKIKNKSSAFNQINRLIKYGFVDVKEGEKWGVRYIRIKKKYIDFD